MTTKKSSTDILARLRTPEGIAVAGATALCLILTIWIFAPGGFLDSLTRPGDVEATPQETVLEPEHAAEHEHQAEHEHGANHEQQQESEVSADLSPEKNADYLATNAKKTGVKVTGSGLQYREIKAGTGRKPGPTDEVTVHYQGTFINGKEFDSSYKRGEPISFPLDGVIAGWTEGLQLMKEGGKAELVIPSDLAYGAGRPGIPPYQTLVFQVELIKVD